MQMNMKDLLHGGLTVSQKEIDALACNSAYTQCGGKTLSHAKHLRAFLFLQVCQISSMSVRNYQNMTRIDRLNIHKGRTVLVLIHDAGFKFPRQYLAKYTVIHLILFERRSEAAQRLS